MRSASCPSGTSSKGTKPWGTRTAVSGMPDESRRLLVPTWCRSWTWTSEKSDHGFVGYQYSMDADATKSQVGKPLKSPVSSP